jgi:hypothetical protein
VKDDAEKGPNGRQNGRPPQDAVMIIDSDEEDAAPQEAFIDKPQFEEYLDD